MQIPCKSFTTFNLIRFCKLESYFRKDFTLDGQFLDCSIEIRRILQPIDFGHVQRCGMISGSDAIQFDRLKYNRLFFATRRRVHFDLRHGNFHRHFRMKAHNMQLQAVALGFLNKFQMAKLITHIHQYAPVRRLVPMTVAVRVFVVVVPAAVRVGVFVVVVPAATAEGRGHEGEWYPFFHINFAG